MQCNPEKMVKQGVVEISPNSEIQQVGIDVSLQQTTAIDHGSSQNVLFNEKIKLPDNIYADLKVRSSFSRQGIFISNGIYDPGYFGAIGCTIYNMSGDTIVLPEGQTIAQLICYKADAASTYNGQWQGKTTL